MTEAEKEILYSQMIKGQLPNDIILVEDLHKMPLMYEEYILRYYYIGLCVRGEVIGCYDYQNYHFKAGDICWLMPDHVMRHDEASDDYSVVSLFIDKNYFQKLKDKIGLPRIYYPLFVTTISLDPHQFDMMLHGIRMIGKLATCDNAFRDELICRMCDIIAVLGDEYIIQHNPDILKTQKTHIQLFERFYDAIIKYHCESREVAFYADKLSLTPKYFASVIIKITGQRASDWINHYVIVKAKWMLQHEHQKTIQQIALQLGFTEQASFSRFFKDNTGMRPSAYRSKM